MNLKTNSTKSPRAKSTPLIFAFGALALFTACPRQPEPSPISPGVSPTPMVSVTPVAAPTPEMSPTATPTPQRTPFPLTSVAPEDRISGEFFLLEFGPGSKGLETTPFGPGSKGLEQTFGPGSKGLENLKFDVNFQETLVRSGISGFNTKQTAGGPLIQRLRIELVRNNQLYAVANILPALPIVRFGARVHPGRYSMFTLAENGNGPPVQMSWSQVEITETQGAQVRIAVYSSGQKPEDLDIELLTRKIPIAEPSAVPSAQPTAVPSAIASPAPNVSASPTASPSP